MINPYTSNKINKSQAQYKYMKAFKIGQKVKYITISSMVNENGGITKREQEGIITSYRVLDFSRKRLYNVRIGGLSIHAIEDKLQAL